MLKQIIVNDFKCTCLTIYIYQKWNVKLCDFNVNKHNTELQRTDPGTKVTGEFSTRGHIFSPNV